MNKGKFASLVLFVLLIVAPAGATAQTKGEKKPPAPAKKTETVAKKPAGPATADDPLKAQLDALVNLPAAERVEKLRAFVEANPRSPLRGRASELLTSARAALADEKLRTGDVRGGIELFRQAVAEAPAEMPDKLYYEVVSQLPANLFLRGETSAAFDLARRIEERVKTDPKRLLALAAFYLGVEQSDEAARVAQQVTQLAPDMAAAHQALGAAHRIALRLEPAAKEYARALELDPQSANARRSLADLYRALGRSEEALALYRAQLTTDPKDNGARAGVVLSLFDAGKREEAEKELEAALGDQSTNLPLLVGAAYWYAARGEGQRALDLAARAVNIEPRYTWAQIALARALVALKRPLEAERALRFAQQYGRFPTLDYELANTLVASGLYEEAAEELARSFTLTDGQIETRLAGRTPARSSNFIELLAPERRASIFQPSAADAETNARVLKGLLAFHQALNTAGERRTTVDESVVASAAKDFTAGEDETRAFRQLYVADRLLKRGVAMPVAFEATEGAINGVEAALDSPVATVATVADELRDMRARAIAAGEPTNLPPAPRNRLSSVLRGRIEDAAGWALFNQGKASEAVVRLRRAASVLPESTAWWRTALWHLGLALEASGNQTEALATLIKSYDRQTPDLARRAIIENLYRKVNGSLEGLESRIGPVAAAITSVSAPTSSQPERGGATETPAATGSDRTLTRTPEQPLTESAQTSPAPVQQSPAPASSQKEATEQLSAAASAPTREQTAAASQSQTPAPLEQLASASVTPTTTTPTPAETPSTTPTPSQTPETTTPAAAPRTSTAAAPAPERTTAPKRRQPSGASGGCSLSLAETALTLKRNGGSQTVTINLDRASDAAKVTATTANWADIIVLAEPRASADDAFTRFTISSVSNQTGTFVVTFTSPCGKLDVPVMVK